MAKINTPETMRIDVDAIKNAIRALESPKVKRDRERAALFGAVYPDIREQLEAGVSKSALVKKMADHGVSISNGMFDELLAAEAKSRGEPVPGKEASACTDDVPADESKHAPQPGATESENA